MTKGGKRKNAGRRKGSGRFGEPTAIMRVPVSLHKIVGDFIWAMARIGKKRAIDEDAIREWLQNLENSIE